VCLLECRQTGGYVTEVDVGRVHALIITTGLIPALQGLAGICEKVKHTDTLVIVQPRLEKGPGQDRGGDLVSALLHETLPQCLVRR
jgi:hypothetical protein